jgi:hypothetical protein
MKSDPIQIDMTSKLIDSQGGGGYKGKHKHQGITSAETQTPEQESI